MRDEIHCASKGFGLIAAKLHAAMTKQLPELK